MPEYSASEEENSWYLWCVRNNIRVSPGGVQGNPDCWTIDICTDGKTWKKSPKQYDRDNIWPEYYKICLWFYNKYKK